ncbi:unnamed protein product, partial [Leptidea sinapis]
MFYAAAITSHIVIWRLSCSWQRLSIYWLSVESALNIKQVPRDETLKRKLRTVTIFICFGGAVEHLMNILSSIGLHCAPPDVMRTYILKSHGFLLLEHEYNEMIALAVVFASIFATVLWNFLDLLIILYCKGLTSRYLRLNICVETICLETQHNNISK